MRRFRLSAVLALAATVAAGCGGGNGHGGGTTATVPDGKLHSPLPEAMSGGDTKPSDPNSGSTVPRAARVSALPPAARKQVASMEVRPAPQRATAAQDRGAPPAALQDKYHRFVRAVIPLVNNYWA